MITATTKIETEVWNPDIKWHNPLHYYFPPSKVETEKGWRLLTRAEFEEGKEQGELKNCQIWIDDDPAGWSQTCTLDAKEEDIFRTKAPLPKPFDKWRKLITEGNDVEYCSNVDGEWYECYANPDGSSWDSMVYKGIEFRIKPEDPYKELKEAYADGKMIQLFAADDSSWIDIYSPMFDSPVEYYRIKPRTVPDPTNDAMRAALILTRLDDNKYEIIKNRIGSRGEVNTFGLAEQLLKVINGHVNGNFYLTWYPK